MERHGMPNYQREHPEQQVPFGVPGRRDDDDGARHLFLDAGRVLMLWGWGTLAAASAAGRNNDDDGRPDTSGAAVHALLAFVAWLLGVSLVLVALVHVERRRFPRAARVAAAATNAVIDCFFVRPWN